MVKPQLSRRGRRRRMWLNAQIILLKKKSSDPRRMEQHKELLLRIKNARLEQCKDGQAPDDYVGIRCTDLDAIVDLKAMWRRLEDLMTTPQLSTKVDTVVLSEAVPILTKRRHSANACDITMCSVLFDGERNNSTSHTEPVPDFIIRDGVEISEGRSGRGFYATRDIPCGSTVLVEKPVAAVLDVETRRNNTWADLPSADTSALTCRIAKKLSGLRGKLLRRLMMPLHPKEGAELPVLQTGDEEDEDAEEDAELAAQMQQDLKNAFVSVPGGEQIESRVHAVARLNGLGYYTNPEQLCHNDVFRSFTGTGLCLIASAFNHNCSPNVTRYSIGDVLIFRTTTSISVGEELCISYIESESLCENLALRRQCLNRDFVCMCSKCSAEDATGRAAQKMDEDTNFLSVDAQLQGELSMMPPRQRADFCRSLLRGELPPELRGEEEEDEDVGPSNFTLLLKDSQEIRAVLGLALLKMNCFREAWEVWLEAAKLAASNGPACDEALGVYVVHAAFSAIAASSENEAEAMKILKTAAALHVAAFGGAEDKDALGIGFFQQKYAKEVVLITELTSDSMAQERQRSLWTRLLDERTQLLNADSWLQIKNKVLSWKVPREAPAIPKKKKSDARQTGQNLSEKVTLAKPKAQVVNGLRVLP